MIAVFFVAVETEQRHLEQPRRAIHDLKRHDTAWILYSVIEYDRTNFSRENGCRKLNSAVKRKGKFILLGKNVDLFPGKRVYPRFHRICIYRDVCCSNAARSSI